jgi:hypothetical protein
MLLMPDAARHHRGQRREHHGLADGAHDVRNPELIAGIIRRRRRVHKAVIAAYQKRFTFSGCAP